MGFVSEPALCKRVLVEWKLAWIAAHELPGAEGADANKAEEEEVGDHVTADGGQEVVRIAHSRHGYGAECEARPEGLHVLQVAPQAAEEMPRCNSYGCEQGQRHNGALRREKLNEERHADGAEEEPEHRPIAELE